MKKILILLILSISLQAYTLVAGPSKIEGKIKSFDTKTLIIESEDFTFEIPREFVGQKNLKSGEKIEILFSLDQADKVKILKNKSGKK
jgi:hypothetical protein